MPRYLSVIKSYTSALPQYIIPTIVSLLTFGILARLLTAREIGVYGLLVSIIYLIGLSSNFGLKKALIVEISKDSRSWRYARAATKLTLLIIFIISLATTLTLAYFKMFYGLLGEEILYPLFFLLLILFSIRNYLSFGLEAEKKFHIPTLYTSIGFIVYRVLMLALVVSGLSILGIIVSWIIGESLSTAALIRELVKYRGFWTGEGSILTVKPIIGKAPHIFLSDMTLSLIEYGDRIVTSLFGLYYVANFYIASTGAQAIAALAYALYSGLLPHISEEARKNDRKEFEDYIQRLTKYTMVFLSPIYITAAVLAYPLIVIFVGTSYSAAISQFQIIVLGLWITTMLPLVTNILLATDLTKELMFIQLLGFLVDIAIMVGLYSYIGYLSAGFGKAALYIVTLSLGLVIVAYKLGITPYNFIYLGKTMLANLGTAAAVWILWILTFRVTFLPIYIAAAIVTYLVLLRYLKIVEPEDIEILYQELPLKGKARDIIFKLISKLTGVERREVLHNE